MAHPVTPLPSMTALRCFATAARTGNFTRAAIELNLTQSAVSRQIANLEELVGAKLFRRAGPYLQLTDRGRAYAQSISGPVATIAAATERFRSDLDSGIVTLATLPSFGMRWLAPRLTRLTRDLPELVINLFARSDEFDFTLEVYDAAIHFGEPDWPGVLCDRLFGERCVPVVSAEVAAMNRSRSTTEQLDRIPLLTLANRPRAWEEWAQRTGLTFEQRKRPAQYEHFAMLAQAAVGGAGAALIPDYLIRDELQDGRLVPLTGESLETPGAYHLVYPAEKLEKSAFRKFRSWLVNEAAVFDALQ